MELRRGPWAGPLGALAWGASLRLYEAAVMGRYSWWWRMGTVIRRHGKGESPDQLVRRLRGDRPGTLAYGETPPVSVLRMLRLTGLPEGSRVLDLGSGRGVPCLTAACLGFPAQGLEYFQIHVDRANQMARELGVNAHFQQGNMVDVAWPEAELVMVASTAFPEDFRDRLEERLRELPAGTRVVTHDWLLGEGFERQGLAILPVSWGTAQFCLHRREETAGDRV